MISEDNVVDWFNNMQSHSRINLMSRLIKTCAPFEVRLFGNCIEEIGKYSFQRLHDSSIRANNLNILSSDYVLVKGLSNENTRNRLISFLSLLGSRNFTCANWIYRNILHNEELETYMNLGYVNEGINELLLIYTIASIHPAFSYGQKRYFKKQIEVISAIEENISNCSVQKTRYLLESQEFYNCAHDQNAPPQGTLLKRSDSTVCYNNPEYGDEHYYMNFPLPGPRHPPHHSIISKKPIPCWYSTTNRRHETRSHCTLSMTVSTQVLQPIKEKNTGELTKTPSDIEPISHLKNFSSATSLASSSENETKSLKSSIDSSIEAIPGTSQETQMIKSQTLNENLTAFNRIPSCYNCGHLGHTGDNCQQVRMGDMEEMKYVLQYVNNSHYRPRGRGYYKHR